jgi:hypothetical protein
MNTKRWIHMIVLIAFMLGLAFTLGIGGATPVAGQSSGEDTKDLPGWPLPAKPIPHHEAGHLSPANSYTAQGQRPDEQGEMRAVQMTGLDALVEDGYDPLAGNYTLVNSDKLLRSSYLYGGPYGLETFALSDTISLVEGSLLTSNPMINDIAAGDLNNDGRAEQITAWLDADSTINFSVGEMPGSAGKASSAPTAVAAGITGADLNLLVRGYDDSLWHCQYTTATGSCTWDNDGAGGRLLSAPAVISRASGQFDVYAILSDNLVYSRTYDDGGWSSSWTLVDDPTYWQPPEQQAPELPAPAVAARGGGLDLFRLGPDNTLRWRYYNGSVWGAWQNLGGAFASGPSALPLSSNSVQVFARGMDDFLWTRIYNGAWGNWQRVSLDGLPENVTLLATPAVASFTSGQLEVYMNGSDRHAWTVHYNGTTWGAWADAGGDVASGLGLAKLGGNPYLFSQTVDDDLQVSPAGAPWTPLNGPTPCCTVVDTGLPGQSVILGVHDFTLDLEHGYIWGDGRSQLVMGYYADATHVNLALFDLSDSPGAKGFTPQIITEIEVENANQFHIATGDFLDRDGVDEIAIAYINRNNDNVYTVEIYRFNRDLANPALVKELSLSTDFDPDGNWYFSGTLEITPGDFDYDGQEEIALLGFWAKYREDGPGTCNVNDYRFITRYYDVDTTAPGEYTLKKYWLPSGDQWDNEAWVEGAHPTEHGLALTTADINGDGQDEIVRTWPGWFAQDRPGCSWGTWLNMSNRFVQHAQHLMLPDNEDPNHNTWDTNGDGSIDVGNPSWYTVGTTAESYNSGHHRLAAGDFNRDIQDEIYFQFTMSDPALIERVFHWNGTGYETVTERFTANHHAVWTRLATADFTGESLRVGPPSVRIQQMMLSPIVLLHLPPMHRDIVNGEEITTDNAAEATHSTTNSANETSSSVSVRDWSLSADLESSIGGGGHKVTASMSNTYGENFSNTTTAIAKRVLTAETTASAYDQVIYNRTDYKIWEYPVYGVRDGELVEADTISVVFPLVNTTSLPTPKSGQWCDESFYTPSHQLYNIWSYDDVYNETDFADLGEMIASQVTTGGSNLTLEMEEGSTYELSNGYKNQFSAGLGYSYENELDIPLIGNAFSFSFNASVKGTYDVESTSTLTTEYANASSVNITVPSDGTFDMGIYLYWAKAGYLVVDYRTTPGSGSIWGLYDKPDPAFILPWYGFPDPETGEFPASGPDTPDCGFSRQLFTHDIRVFPAYAEIGETVTISATVRNFSAVTPQTASDTVNVHFYLGEPAGDNQISTCTIADADLERLNGPQSCTVEWVVDDGFGREKIFAVIDPEDTLLEMHDENDVIDNNRGYGELYIARTDYLDPGLQTDQTYLALEYQDAFVGRGNEASGRGFGLYQPTTNLNQIVRYELLPTALSQTNVIGHPIQVLAYQGGQEAPEEEHVFGTIPAMLTAYYRDSDLLPDMQEANLKLYRLESTGWVESTCPGYEVIRIPEDNYLAVPVCSAGTFILADALIEPPPFFIVYLPLIWK